MNIQKDGNYLEYFDYLKLLNGLDPEKRKDLQYIIVFILLYQNKCRIGEILGDSPRRYCGSCQRVIRCYELSDDVKKFRLKLHCECGAESKPEWRSSLRGILKKDIDSVISSEWGIQSPHNLRIFGKGSTFNIMDLDDTRLSSKIPGLFTLISKWLNGIHIKEDEKIFNLSRLSVYNKLRYNKQGITCINGRSLHPHSMRRASAVRDSISLNISLPLIQHALRHATLNQTLQYCRLSARDGYSQYSKLRFPSSHD